MSQTEATQKLIAALDAVSEAALKLAAMFPSPVVSAERPVVDAPAAKPTKPAKTTPTPKSTNPTPQAPEGMTIDEVRGKMKELIVACGSGALVELFDEVGVKVLSDVKPTEYADLCARAQRRTDEASPEAPEADGAAPEVLKGPTLDDVKLMAGKLIEADKPAYLKIMTKLGKPSDMHPPEYAAAIEAYEQAMPSAGDEEDLM